MKIIANKFGINATLFKFYGCKQPESGKKNEVLLLASQSPFDFKQVSENYLLA